MADKNIYARRGVHPETVPAPTGTMYDKTYSIEIDETGHKEVYETGETNRYAEIQEYLEETKIENILIRAGAGDETVLNAKSGEYYDATDIPTTLAEAQNKIIKLREEFEKLPIETKKKFDFSPEKYVNDFGTESWAEAMGYKQTTEPTPEPTKENGGVENE